MRIGKLRTLITVMHKTITPDGLGGVIEEWTQFAQMYGCQSVRRAWEKVSADQQSSLLNVNWESRFVDGITPDMRLVIHGLTYEILGVYDPSQKGERLMIVTRVLQNNGASYATADSDGQGNQGCNQGHGQLPQEGRPGAEEDDDSGLYGDGGSGQGDSSGENGQIP